MDTIWIKKSFRDIRRNKLKVLPLMFLLICGTTLSIGEMDAVSSFDNSFNIAWNLHHYHQALLTLKPMSEEELNNFITKTIAKTRITGVSYESRAFFQTTYNDTNIDVFAVNGSRVLSVDSLIYENGTPLYMSNTPNAAVIEQASAQTYNLSNVKQLNITSQYGAINLHIVNQVYSPEHLWKASFKTWFCCMFFKGVVVWMKLSNLLHISNTSNIINQLALYFQNPAKDQQKFLSAFIQIAGSGNVMSISGRDPILSALDPLYTGLTLFIDIIIFGASLIMTFIIISRIVEEEYPVLGLYKAMGMKNREVILPILIFSLTIGLLGSIIGVIIGILSSGTFYSAIAETIVAVPGANLKFNWDFIIFYFFLPIVVIIIATLFAIRKIYSIDPQLLIRPTSEMSVPKESTMTRLYNKIQKSKASPFRLYSLRYLSQERSKVFGIFIGILLATTIIAFSFNFLIAYNNSYNNRFAYDKWDSDITFNSFINHSEVPNILDLHNFKGRVTYDTQVITSTRISSDLTNAYIVTGVNPGTKYQYFENNKSVSNGQLLITIDLALKYNLVVGSSVQVVTANNTLVTLGINGILSVGQSRSIFTTEQTARLIAGVSNESLINGVFLKTNNPTELSVFLQMENNNYIQNTINLSTIKQQQAQSNQIFAFVLYFIVFMGIALGIIITLTIITISISERKNDLINFRSLGIKSQEFFSIIFFELFYSSIPGLLTGLLVGNEIMVQTNNYFASAGFVMNYSPDIVSITLTILSIIITGVITSFVSLRSVLKTNIAEYNSTRMLG